MTTTPKVQDVPVSVPGGAFAEVALPVPLRQEFTYRVPEAFRARLRPGSVVRVPFGTRTLNGFVVRLVATTPVGSLKEIAGVEEEELSVPEEVLELCRWVADYYLAPWGEVLRAALPAGLGRRTREFVPGDPGPAPAVTLGAEQKAALEAIGKAVEAGGPTTFLLHGVTGSGKTEVYLRAARQVVDAGGKVLVLIPEIALSPQMVQRVEARFGSRAALWHSALTPSRRREVWGRTRRGEIDVLIGARSAIFAPLPDLKLIVVDEEHENAYKQSESPRYHARDVALVRAQKAGAVTILGSATPSLESFANAGTGKYHRLILAHRVEHRPPSTVQLVPVPRADQEPRPVSLILGDPLRHAVADTLSAGEQTILFLNRRGHSTVAECDTCRAALACSQCDITLTWHSVGDRVVCHYCGRSRKRPDRCPTCGGAVSIFKGVGTQRVVTEIERLFSGVRVLRLDTDSTRKRGTLEAALETFREGEADVLLGTQMVAKGLDFPRVTLVGVIHADLQLFLPDFRSGERTFQLLTQVAGRSGRGDRPGRVIFQTGHPEHIALTSAAAQDYEAFYRAEIETRRDPAYPPHVRLVNLMFDGPREEAVIEVAEEAAGVLRKETRGGGVEILGPAPQPLSRLRGKYRWHITLRGPDHRALRRTAGRLLAWSEGRVKSVRIAVDVDPVSLL